MNLVRHLTPDFVRLDTCINRQLYSDVVLVQQVASYIVQAGGKRMRPAMLMLAADALGLRDDPRITELATIIEFIHTATLLHDDVVDNSSQRRGKQTANALFGNSASVLVGDFLYSRAFQMMVGLERPNIMAILADTTNVIAEGEVLQLMYIGDVHLTEAQYLQVIEYKTAKLFEAAACLPAVLINDSYAQAALAIYGRKIGSAFQIIDDVLDYQGDAAILGKNLGDDLREGKVTLPLIYAMQYGSEVQRELIITTISAIQNNNSNNNSNNNLNNNLDNNLSNNLDANLNEIIAIIKSVNATQKSIDVAQSLINEALDALKNIEHLGHTEAVDALRELAQQAVNRRT
jgi:octaprenyl-diphosphate synthase